GGDAAIGHRDRARDVPVDGEDAAGDGQAEGVVDEQLEERPRRVELGARDVLGRLLEVQDDLAAGAEVPGGRGDEPAPEHGAPRLADLHDGGRRPADAQGDQVYAVDRAGE